MDNMDTKIHKAFEQKNWKKIIRLSQLPEVKTPQTPNLNTLKYILGAMNKITKISKLQTSISSKTLPFPIGTRKFPDEIAQLSMLNMGVRDVLSFCSTNKLIANEVCNDIFWKKYAQKYGLSKKPNKSYKDLFIRGTYELWAIGNNHNSQFGSGSGNKSVNDQVVQIKMPDNLLIRDVDSLDNMTIVVDENFDAWVFGNTGDKPHQFGLGAKLKSELIIKPTRLNMDGVKIKRVFLNPGASYIVHSRLKGGILIDTRGGIWLFGYNSLHQNAYLTPTKVEGTGENGIVSEKAYGYYNNSLLILDVNGAVWVIGYSEGSYYYSEENQRNKSPRLMKPKRLEIGKRKKFKDVYISKDAYYLNNGRDEYIVLTDRPIETSIIDVRKGHRKMNSQIYLDTFGYIRFNSRDWTKTTTISGVDHINVVLFWSKGWTQTTEVRCGFKNGVIIDRGNIYGVGENLNGQIGMPLSPKVKKIKHIALKDNKKCYGASVGDRNIFMLLK